MPAGGQVILHVNSLDGSFTFGPSPYPNLGSCNGTLLYYLIIYKALLSLYYSGDFFFFGGNFAVLSLNNGSILNENIFFYHCWAIGYPTRRYEGVLLALNLKRKKVKFLS